MPRPRSFADEEGDDGAFGQSRERLPNVQFLAFAEREIEDVVHLAWGKGFGEQVARLADVAEQIGAGREVGCEFFHETVERRRRDRAESRPRRGRLRADPADRSA